MPVYYIESSAWLKRYKSEKGADVVNELFEARTENELFVTSHLTVLEISTVVARLLKGNVISAQQYDHILGTLSQDLSDHRVVVVPLHYGLVQETIDMLPRFPLRTADALRFATGLRVSRAAAAPGFCLVSADREIVAACTGYKINYLDPEHPSALVQLRGLR